MNKSILISVAVLLSVSARTQTNTSAAATHAPTAPKTVSIQEMLVIGPSSMKLHALTTIIRGSVEGGIDESYLPGFKACAEDPLDLVRSLTAKLLGKHFVEGSKNPNPEAIALLIKLATDESSDVRYGALYYGLAPLEEKPPEIIQLLIEAAATDRDKLLNKRIAESLEDYRDAATKILDKKLKSDNPIAFFEIYEQLTGKEPAATDRLLDMPSSLPVLFIFTGKGDDSKTLKAELESELKAIGLKDPELSDYGADQTYVLMLKTYITRDRVIVEKAFANHEKFAAPQILWLTPEREVEFEEWRNK